MSVTETGTWSTSSSARRASVNPLTACLLAEYMPWSGMARSDATLPRLTIAPPRCRRCRAATSDPYTSPQKFVSNSRRESSSATSSSFPKMDTPASFTHVSNPPNRSNAAVAIRSTSSRLLTSAVTATALGPSSDATRWTASVLRAASTRPAPCSAARRAVASPIPLLAPVITMTCSRIGLRW